MHLAIDTKRQRHYEVLVAGFHIVKDDAKNSDDLTHDRAAVGVDDFLSIVASWLDQHPDGLGNGARVFRQALDA